VGGGANGQSAWYGLCCGPFYDAEHFLQCGFIAALTGFCFLVAATTVSVPTDAQIVYSEVANTVGRTSVRSQLPFVLLSTF
jgi:hypothetical protein